MALGYRGNADWRDMSEYVVHFTKGADGSNGYDTLLRILWTGAIEARSVFGMARNMVYVAHTQAAACFSEIPLEYLDRLTNRRESCYGLAFRKEFVIASGGGPVWYVEHPSLLGGWVEAVKDTALNPSFVPDHPVWRITPFIERPGDYNGATYRFEWEREWRVPGGLCFTPDRVAFLFLPESDHQAAYGFFHDAYEQNTGPAYFCPYIDPGWDAERLQQAFAQVSGSDR
jgi:hypothetical protein